jgi:Putative Ig domain
MPAPIDLQLRPFEFKLGGIDLTNNVMELRLKRPEVALTTPQKTTVSFTLLSLESDHDRNKLNPEIHAEFCPLALECTLKVDSILLFTGWIQEYKYDELALSATGTLIDAIEYLTYDRAAAEIKDIEIGAGTSVGEAVKKLLIEAGKDFADQSIYGSNRIATPNLTGVFSAPLVSSSPTADAQKYASADLMWMYCLPNGDIAWKKYPTDGSPAFRRSLAELETFQNDPYAFPIMATKVCVRGSHEEAKPDPAAEDLPLNLDNGKLSEVVTYSKAPRIALDPNLINPSTIATAEVEEFREIKTITYQYTESNSRLLSTTTKIEKPQILIDPDGSIPNTVSSTFTLRLAEVIVETATVKRIEKTRREIDQYLQLPSTEGIPWDLILYSEESIENPTAFENYINANTPPRDTSPPPPYKVDTVPVCGCAIAASTTCISPFLKRPRYEDVGYLYNQSQAVALAQWMVTRAVQLYKSYLIEMPPPLEWLQDPSPFTICDIHNRRWIVEVPELVLSATDGICKLIFRGLPISSIPPVAPPPETIPFVPPVGLAIAPVAPRIFTIGFAIAPITNIAANGTPPYTWSATLPSGLSIDSSTGVISGTPTVTSAIASYTITVTDSLAAIASTVIEILVEALPGTNPIVGIQSNSGFGRKRGLIVTTAVVVAESVFMGRKRGLIVSETINPPPPPGNDMFINAIDLGNLSPPPGNDMFINATDKGVL